MTHRGEKLRLRPIRVFSGRARTLGLAPRLDEDAAGGDEARTSSAAATVGSTARSLSYGLRMSG